MAERLFKSIYRLYTKPQSITEDFGADGLETIGANLGKVIRHPRRKCVVMLCGNHSAGKSSFVNWYVGEDVQGTGVAVETQGFTVVSSGNLAQELNGQAALALFPHIRDVVQRFEGADRKSFETALSVQISTSRKNEFRLIDLIDTPGLVDGNVSYPFDVNKIIVELASSVDLVLVFLDPMGQALCSRTMAVVEALNKQSYAKKTHYFLTKADTVTSRSDLNRVIVQITQALSRHVSASHGFSVPTIWLPEKTGAASVSNGETNELPLLLDLMKKTLRVKVQNNIAALDEDCEGLTKLLEEAIASEKLKSAEKLRWSLYRWLLWPLLPIIALLSFLDFYDFVYDSLPGVLRVEGFKDNGKALLSYINGVFPTESLVTTLAVWVTLFLVVSGLWAFFGFRIRRLGARSSAEVARLKRNLDAVARMREYGTELHVNYVRAAQKHEYDA